MKIGGMLKNPMTIMMIISMVVMIALPKMMANLDPEQLEVSQAVPDRIASDLVSANGAFPGSCTLRQVPMWLA